MKYLALTLPGDNGTSVTVTAPGGVPTGGLHDTGGKIITNGIEILLAVVSILSLFYLVYGGLKWTTSGGDPEKIAGARLTMTYAIIGLGISLLSFTIMGVLSTFFKVNLLAF